MKKFSIEKLESLESEKFGLSKEEQESVLGGSFPSWRESRRATYPGMPIHDEEIYDICVFTD